MSKKNTADTDQVLSAKDYLDNILGDMLNKDFNTQKQDQTSVPLEPLPRPSLDYDLITRKSAKRAQGIINSIVSYYLPKELINDRYVRSKMSLDRLTVSNLLFQMETSEHAIKTLLNEIDIGNLHPRMFEVLSRLQTSKMEIIKHLKQVEIIMENNYRNLYNEYENKRLRLDTPKDVSESPKQLQSGNGYNAVGTRTLLKDILIEDE